MKATFLEEIAETSLMEDIPLELILNWDQSGLSIVPASSWTMERKDWAKMTNDK